MHKYELFTHTALRHRQRSRCSRLIIRLRLYPSLPRVFSARNLELRLRAAVYLEGLTILGGEPLEPGNQRELLPFVETVRREFPDKTIWVYSGFTLEELLNRTGEHGAATESLLSQLDILVDGRFIEAKKDLRLKFCGSSNQRIIDLKKTKAAEKIVLWEDHDAG